MGAHEAELLIPPVPQSICHFREDAVCFALLYPFGSIVESRRISIDDTTAVTEVPDVVAEELVGRISWFRGSSLDYLKSLEGQGKSDGGLNEKNAVGLIEENLKTFGLGFEGRSDIWSAFQSLAHAQHQVPDRQVTAVGHGTMDPVIDRPVRQLLRGLGTGRPALNKSDAYSDKYVDF